MALGDEGTFDLARLDTTPGAASPFAPPAPFDGDGRAYRALLRSWCERDRGVRQRLAVARQHRDYALSGRAEPQRIEGPFAAELERVLTTAPR